MCWPPKERSDVGDQSLDEIIHCSKHLHGKNISVVTITWNLHQLPHYRANTVGMLILESLLQVLDKCTMPFLRVKPKISFSSVTRGLMPTPWTILKM